jgi:hypothetical protein
MRFRHLSATPDVHRACTWCATGGEMNVNLQAWDNFLGRSLIVFLMIEGMKTFPGIERLSAGSVAFKFLENIVMNIVLAILVRGTGSDIFIGEGPWPLVLSIVFGSLATAGLHRLKIAFERRSPSDPAWQAQHGR